MTDDENVLREKVAQLLGERRPDLRKRNSDRSYSGTPIGFAIEAFVMACDLVDTANYVEALRGWEECHTELRSWQDVLNAGPVDEACREAATAALDSLLMRFAVRSGRSVGLSQELASACKRVQQLVECCAKHQAEIRTTAEVRLKEVAVDGVSGREGVMAAARADASACYRVADKKIQVETQRVLLLHKGTAEVSTRELYEQAAQRN